MASFGLVSIKLICSQSQSCQSGSLIDLTLFFVVDGSRRSDLKWCIVKAETELVRDRMELVRDDMEAERDIRGALTSVEVEDEEELFVRLLAVEMLVIVDVVDMAQLAEGGIRPWVEPTSQLSLV